MYTENKTLGKFEGNRSQYEARVLYDFSVSGFHDEECGNVDYRGWYCLIKGKLYTWICEEDNNGFFTVKRFSNVNEAESVWDDIRQFASVPEEVWI